jgi:translation elongation factor EF-1beta
VGGAAAAPAAAAAKPAAKPAAGSDSDDSDLDLFGDATPEEQAAQEAKAKVVAEAKARAAEKGLLSKSMIILDVKPWDDETDMAKLEAHVRSIEKDGLLWGTSKLVPVGFGIKKLQITAVIQDSKARRAASAGSAPRKGVPRHFPSSVHNCRRAPLFSLWHSGAVLRRRHRGGVLLRGSRGHLLSFIFRE